MSAAATIRLASRPTWVEVSMRALSGNVAALLQHARTSSANARCELIAVVKANGYGHGAAAAARAALDGGAHRLAVATLGEALELRAVVGASVPILVMGSVDAWTVRVVCVLGGGRHGCRQFDEERMS